MAKKKREPKPKICTAVSYHNGKRVAVARFERVGNEFRPLGETRFISDEEQEEFRRKVCESIGRTASELPGFQ